MKTIDEYEREYGYVLINLTEAEAQKETTESDFLERTARGPKVAIDHANRVEFLQTNGYPVTRENLINSDLNAKIEAEDSGND